MRSAVIYCECRAAFDFCRVESSSAYGDKGQ